jgi:hypothetical protein
MKMPFLWNDITERVQGCTFTKECPAKRQNCTDKCTLNADRIKSVDVAQDRAYKEDWWAMCPDLAKLVYAFTPREGRRLQASTDVRHHRMASVLTAVRCSTATTAAHHVPLPACISRMQQLHATAAAHLALHGTA